MEGEVQGSKRVPSGGGLANDANATELAKRVWT